MKNERMIVDDPWVLTRTGHFSSSFSDFLLQISPDMSEEERKELEKAGKEFREAQKDIEKTRRLLGPHGVDELNIPSWLSLSHPRYCRKFLRRFYRLLQAWHAIFLAAEFSLSVMLCMTLPKNAESRMRLYCVWLRCYLSLRH